MKTILLSLIYTFSFTSFSAENLPNLGKSSNEINFEIIGQVNKRTLPVNQARVFWKAQRTSRYIINSEVGFYCAKKTYKVSPQIEVESIMESFEFNSCVRDFASTILQNIGVEESEIQSLIHYYDNSMYVGTNNQVQYKEFWSNHKLLNGIIDKVRLNCSESVFSNLDIRHINSTINNELCTSQNVKRIIVKKVDSQPINLEQNIINKLLRNLSALI